MAVTWIVVDPGGARERVVPVEGRLVVGRECAGVPESQRLVTDDPAISRDHFEVRIDGSGRASLVDLSTNGTRVNARRVERGETIALADGDLIEAGGLRLAFRAPSAPAHEVPDEVMSTIRSLESTHLAIVVGDIIGYTSLVEKVGGSAVAAAIDSLFTDLSRLLAEHRGTVSNYIGDALFGAWDMALDQHGEAPGFAVAYALAAAELVERRSETMRMGWAVTCGDVATGRPSPGHETVYGDAVNLAFRLSGVAGREGRAPVLVTEDAAGRAAGSAEFGPVEEIMVKGRAAPARVRAALRP